MKKILFLSWMITAITSCSTEKNVRVTIENPSDFNRSTEMVEIPINDLKATINLEKEQTYIVKNESNIVIPSQITYDGKLIFQAGTKSKETITYSISAGIPKTFQAKTYGRFIPERKDDFAWENDHVAFRVYGNALVETDGPSNGLDLWYKRTNNLIIDKWYKNDLAKTTSYHEDTGEGLDDYKVGRTLGAGMMAPYASEKLWLNENFIQQEVFENGPLRTTFKLTYKDINVEGKKFSESRTISLDAGSQLTRVTQVYGTDEIIPVAAGIVKREENDLFEKKITKKGTVTLVYAEPKSEKSDNTYVGMIFPTGVTRIIADTYTLIHPKTNKEERHSHILAITTYQPGVPITYYTGYGWSKFGFPTLGDFQTYLTNFAESIETPLIVKF